MMMYVARKEPQRRGEANVCRCLRGSLDMDSQVLVAMAARNARMRKARATTSPTLCHESDERVGMLQQGVLK